MFQTQSSPTQPPDADLGNDIADFLRGAVTSAGEGFLKAVAPVIETAIDVSKDLIAENSLDLAKAVDLSGAFIPSSPLAFASALQLAKTLTSVLADDDDKSVLETIERLEKQVAPFTQQAENVLQQLDTIIKTGEQLEKETHQRVRQAAISAYQALQEAVESALTIQRGNARIQRVDPTVSTKLDAAVASFKKLHEVSSTNAWKLGKDSAALMSFGDNTRTFKTTLSEERQRLKQQLRNNNEARQRHKQHLGRLKASHADHDARRRGAIQKLNNGLNQFAYIFSPSSRDEQKAIETDAEKNLKQNESAQKGVDNKIRALYMLDTLIGWAMRALDVVTESVARIAQDFQAKFQLITNAQEKSNKLFAGLLGLVNKINVTDFRTTRDNSLRVVLDVLGQYHELRTDHDSLEIPGIGERRIHTAIVDKLGKEGVDQLLEPPKPADDGDDTINSM
ncbi:hypothetical protein C8A01DRAFT_48352 [Parachaetomium inaequale]|uniref:Uncharacterized protein n=1 Tax=Parachaetomium inaequale TaxID=2588326 RepID=A0AAN6PBU2_9PEZI|nr:hypothetical protein C8A01DRAFT_48352 [Parachaetomium inaequale]